MKYSTVRKYKRLQEKIIDCLLFPIRYIGTPIYNALEKNKKIKKYSEKQIRRTVQYIIDYYLDNEDDEFYIIADNNYNPFDYCNVSTPFHMYMNMMWSGNTKVKNRASHMYCYQKQQYIDMFKNLCGKPMSLEEKKQWFDSFDVIKIKNRPVYKMK